MLQTILLELLPLQARRLQPFTHNAALSKFIDLFAALATEALDVGTEALVATHCAFADLIDGRLLSHVYKNASEDSLAALGSESAVSLESALRLLGIEKRTTIGQGKGQLFYDGRMMLVEAFVRPGILTFSHAAFDDHLAPLQIDACTNFDQSSRDAKISKELTHWHNSRKPLLEKVTKDMTNWQYKRYLRANQRFMAEMDNYARSLTNSAGKYCEPELIITDNIEAHNKKHSKLRGGEKPATEATASTPRQNKHVKAVKNGKLSKQDIIAANNAKRAETAEAKSIQAWHNVRKDIDGEVDFYKQLLLTETYIDSITRKDDYERVRTEAALVRLNVLLKIWQASYCPSRKETGYHVAALIHNAICNLVTSKLPLPEDALKAVNKLATEMGLLRPNITAPIGGMLTFDPSLKYDVSLSVDMSTTAFQLMHTGPYMDRSMNARPDHRVPFMPDGWQRDVLDELDAGHSLLVVAPTSSGKTFISFYAMEKVLRNDDDGVVVYVAPTKPLVNQIAAEVQARFKKTYKHGSKSLYAIHTRDYRVNNPTACQVLVTVPHILQIMLLSPSNSEWVPKVRSIIFDEVHSISQAEDGVVWEQLLMMSPSQVIALSATIGNPSSFSAWLTDVHEATGRKFTMIQHEQRYSELRKYIYRPGAYEDFNELPEVSRLPALGIENIESFQHINPMSCLSNNQRGLPPDLSLEARDCHLLHCAMQKCKRSTYELPRELQPGTFFKGVIKKAHVLRWGDLLKLHLLKWMADPESPFVDVMQELEISTSVPSRDEEGTESVDGVLRTIMVMLCKLRSAGALPAILFNYNRTFCEKIAKRVFGQLKRAEESFKEKDTAWIKKVKAYKAWKVKRAIETAKIATELNKQSKKSKKDDANAYDRQDRDQILASADNSFQGFDPEAPLPQYSFADLRKQDKDALEKVFSTLRWQGVDETLVLAFQRGIGVHHAGMNRKYRQAVEMWFRKGYLTVVIATGTLALGINMPCKTVVFSGDSVFLTALNFRQAAGRAGRRGFDLLGNVVFQDISVEKVHRLLSSRLPDLTGHFPLTTSFILRVLSMLAGTNNAEYARHMVTSLLAQPRLYLGGDSFKHQVLHHLRFSLEYLRHQGLINAKGIPLDFAHCVSHLFFAEDGAFAFHALLQSGYFHDLARDLYRNEKETLRTLMLVMAHLFGRRPLPPKVSEMEEIVHSSASVVFLPSMPIKVRAVLEKHNADTLNTYKGYVATFIGQHCKEPDTVLPLSKIHIGPSPNAPQIPFWHLPSPNIRSPFVALRSFRCFDIIPR